MAEHTGQLILEEAKQEQLLKKNSKKLWKVCHFSSLPIWLQDNEFLIKSHRPQLQSFKLCFQSVFRMHTETINIWTHLFGFFLFLSILLYVATRPANVIRFEEKIIFIIFLGSAITCFGFSSLFHIINCHSEYIYKLFSKFDYCGIAILNIGSFIPWLYYSFYCEMQSKIIYFMLLFVLGVASVIISVWDNFSKPKFRYLRAGIFAAFGLSAIIPLMHYIMINGIFDAIHRASLGWICLMAFLYLSGTALYALRIPERFFPGKCDIWFQSHQIFHMLCIAAVLVHYNGISQITIYRLLERSRCKSNAMEDFNWNQKEDL